MSRTLDAGVDAALQASHVREVVFLAFEFSDGTLRLCTADHDIAWDSLTWIGAARVGSIEPIGEGGTLESRGLRMSVSGVSASLIATALGTHIQGRALKLWYGQFDATWQILADPVGPFQYRLDAMKLRHGKAGTIEITARDRLADWDRPRIRRYNHQDQIAEYPGDMGLQFVEQMVEKELIW